MNVKPKPMATVLSRSSTHRTETRKLLALPVAPENFIKHMTARKRINSFWQLIGHAPSLAEPPVTKFCEEIKKFITFFFLEYFIHSLTFNVLNAPPIVVDSSAVFVGLTEDGRSNESNSLGVFAMHEQSSKIWNGEGLVLSQFIEYFKS